MLVDCDCTRMAVAVEVVEAEPYSAVQGGRFAGGEADHATAVYHNSPSDTAKAQEAVAAVVADSVVRSAGTVSAPSAHLHTPARRLLPPRAAAAAEVDLQARADQTLRDASTRASGSIALW